MSRTTNRQGSKSRWKRQDAAYREEQRKRRRANTRRRAITAEAVARGVRHEQVRAEWAELGK